MGDRDDIERLRRQLEAMVVPIQKARRWEKLKGCGHARTIIDDDPPALTCADCGAILDPYWALGRIARSYFRWKNDALMMLGEAEKILARVERKHGPQYKRRRVEHAMRAGHGWALRLECGHKQTVRRGQKAPRVANCRECIDDGTMMVGGHTIPTPPA